MGIKVASHSLHILELVLIFTMKLEGSLSLSLYSYFILLLNANKEKLSPLRKWSLRDSHAVQRHILSPGMRPAGLEKWSRRRGLFDASRYWGSVSSQSPERAEQASGPGLTDHPLPPSLNSGTKTQCGAPLLLELSPSGNTFLMINIYYGPPSIHEKF